MSFWDRFRLSRTDTAGQSTEAANTREQSAGSDVDPHDAVAGERGIASIRRTRSLQARVTNILAAGLMSLLALGFLGWYYMQTFARQSHAAASPAKPKPQSQGEMTLPPLGRVDPPVMQQVLGPPPAPPVAALTTEPFHRNDSARGPVAAAYARPGATPAQHLRERRLSGPVFVSASRNEAPSSGTGVVQPASIGDGNGLPFHTPSASNSDTSSLAGLLQPTSTPAAQAKVLPTQRLLLPKGAFLDCTLETAIDTSLPGMTTCITATDSFSADGNVVLLERGTKLVGETRGDVRQGSARVYVLWTEARTPEGVVVPLASPGTDALGRAGLAGDVDRHFRDRFGAAILVSVIDGTIQAAAQRSGDGAVVVNPSTSRDVMTEVLRNTINIPPTVTKQQGDRIAVLVARDLDFRSVYELRPAALDR